MPSGAQAEIQKQTRRFLAVAFNAGDWLSTCANGQCPVESRLAPGPHFARCFILNYQVHWIKKKEVCVSNCPKL